jgi:hypothetical protein
MSNLRQLRKIKVLGYPFAGGQPRGGVELTPGWLKSQQWFQNLQCSKSTPVEYEEIQVSSSFCNSEHAATDAVKCSNGHTLPKNVQNVMKSSE